MDNFTAYIEAKGRQGYDNDGRITGELPLGSQARKDARQSVARHIIEERAAVVLLESMGRGNGTDATFAREELARYESLALSMGMDLELIGAK